MIKFYYGLSGTFKGTTIQEERKTNLNPSAVVWSEIKLWKSLESTVLSGLTKVTDLNFAILHLCNLDNILRNELGNDIFVERGISDMLFYYLKNNNLDETIIKNLIEKEELLCSTQQVEKILLVQKDIEFIKSKVLLEKTRSDVFPGGVDDYLKAQNDYIEFTKKYNKITKTIEITDAQEYLNSLGLEYNN